MTNHVCFLSTSHIVVFRHVTVVRVNILELGSFTLAFISTIPQYA